MTNKDKDKGEEHEFLSNNREIALKVLDQQCYKYHKDDETRDTIVKAFEKLMKNKHMVLYDASGRGFAGFCKVQDQEQC